MATTDVQLRPRQTARSINPDRRHTVVVGLKTSKFRHVSVISGGKEGKFVNLRQVNNRMRPESNGFGISDRWAAVPISGTAGVVAIFELRKPTKVADGVIPGLENGSSVADFAWCPFDENVLAVGCDNGVVNIWTIPDEGVLSTQTVPSKTFKAHNDKINVIKFNPVASDVLATAANNGKIIIWDTDAKEPKINLKAPSSPVRSMAWSSDGRYLAVIFQDCCLRLYEPNANDSPVAETHVLEKPSGARVLFVCNDRFVLISSLSKSSQRTITLHLVRDLSLVHSHPLDTSSSLLIPHYDFDSSVVFLTAKGDRTIHMFEICDEPPHFLQLTPFTAPNAHQAIAFTSKIAVDIRKVEFARGARLLMSELENMTFTVPRVKMDMFQNDLFPPSLATWEASATAQQWFSGADVQRKFIDLKPADMEPIYEDLYTRDLVRYSSAGSVSNGTESRNSSAGKTCVTKSIKQSTETNGATNVDHVDCDNRNGVDGDQKESTISKIKAIADGLVSPSQANSNTVGSPINDRASPPNQPKRLSIDPTCGTPLRDLLRRCDDTPSVMAMRQESDGDIDDRARAEDKENGQTDNPWE